MDENMYCLKHGRKEGTVCDQCGAELVSAMLTEQERGNPGCGCGTPGACYAVTMGPGGFQCATLSNPAIANVAGIRLGWRVNLDMNDLKAWCPKGILANSKKPA